jgi:hypothetical protein
MNGSKHFVRFIRREGPSNVCPRISPLALPLPVPLGNRDVDLFFWSKMELPPKSGAQLLRFHISHRGSVGHSGSPAFELSMRRIAAQFKTMPNLSQILRGKRTPSLSTIVKLARALDVQVADFFRK